MKKQNY